MARIVTTHYRYKRPPRKRKPVEVPAIVRKHAGPLAPDERSNRSSSTTGSPANDDRKPVIVTARRPGARDVPDLTPEEHQRRGDAADALFRKVTGKDRP